jgi:hypothetical protein
MMTLIPNSWFKKTALLSKTCTAKLAFRVNKFNMLVWHICHNLGCILARRFWMVVGEIGLGKGSVYT